LGAPAAGSSFFKEFLGWNLLIVQCHSIFYVGLNIGMYVSTLKDALQSLWGAFRLTFGRLGCLGCV
jgi:hypothetical protein